MQLSLTLTSNPAEDSANETAKFLQALATALGTSHPVAVSNPASAVSTSTPTPKPSASVQGKASEKASEKAPVAETKPAGTPTQDPADKPTPAETPTSTAPETPPPADGPIKLETLQALAATLLSNAERRTFKSILQEVGVQSLSTSPTEQYPVLLEKLTEAVANLGNAG